MPESAKMLGAGQLRLHLSRTYTDELLTINVTAQIVPRHKQNQRT